MICNLYKIFISCCRRWRRRGWVFLFVFEFILVVRSIYFYSLHFCRFLCIPFLIWLSWHFNYFSCITNCIFTFPCTASLTSLHSPQLQDNVSCTHACFIFPFSRAVFLIFVQFNSKTAVAKNSRKNAAFQETIWCRHNNFKVTHGGKENHRNCNEVRFPNRLNHSESLHRFVQTQFLLNGMKTSFDFTQRPTKASLVSASIICRSTDRTSSTDQWAQLSCSAMFT